MTRTLRTACVAPALFAALAACTDTRTIFAPDTNRTYVQVERLGNPLVNEVFIAKRNHGVHNATSPNQDVANLAPEMQAFVNSFGRPAIVGQTLTQVLLPDELIVDPTKATNTAGWLSWALASGYGGRLLTDDVVDAGTAAIFGSLLSPTNTIPSLVGDNVNASQKPFLATFPYLATPNP
ncbi:MAG: DUF4331 family protein [Gemmatimonadetes bacterium]|nr:DUF4331 family protein [Gemmatimonadota bacterium]